MSMRSENRPGYKKTKVGWIPEEWEAIPVGQLLEFKNGLNKAKEFFGKGTPIVNYMDVLANSGLFTHDIAGKVTVSSDEIKNYQVQQGDVFFTRTSETVEEIGMSSVMLDNIKDSVFSGFVLRGRPTNDKLDLFYKKYCFRTAGVRKQIITTSSYTTRALTNGKLLSKVYITLPPLPEQKKIAEILSAWDKAIEQVDKLIEAKKKRFKGLIQTLISNQCEDWKHLKSNKLFDSVSEKNHPDKELLSVTQKRGVIPRSMLDGKVMSPEGSTSMYKLIKKGDFVISLRSFQGGIEYTNYQGIISPAYTVLRPKIKLHNEFYRRFFKTYLFIEKYLRIAVIGIRDGKQISIPDFMTVKIPFPPLKQQKEIAETLSIAQHEIDILKKLAYTYRKQKRGLMQKLLTGQIRVKV